MKWCVAHFSPTGGTKKIANLIADGFQCEYEELDLTDYTKDVSACGEYDAILVCAPVFGGRIPQMAVDQLEKLDGTGKKAVAVAVYGNREFDDALAETSDVLKKAGFSVIAAAAFIAEHSIDRQIATARPDEGDAKIAVEFAQKVMEKLQSEEVSEVEVPGNRPYVERKPAAVHPMAVGECDKCGICVKECPLQAISAEDPTVLDGDKCINCMRCVQVCPKGAKAFPAPALEGVHNMLSKVAAGHKEPQLFLS